jgi:hypothetical protein
MPLPDSLQAVVSSKEFWLQLRTLRSSQRIFPSLKSCWHELPLTAEYALVFYLDERVENYGLYLRHPGTSEPEQLGFGDSVYWHFDTLRWEELDWICRCWALGDPALPHPGVGLLLLERFAPICQGVNARIVFPLRWAAWRSLGLFSDEEIEALAGPLRGPHRREPERWQKHKHLGWTYPGDVDAGYLFSLRHPGNVAHFPFKALNAMLESVRRFCRAAVRPWARRKDGRVVELARRIADRRDFTCLPDFGDALAEAGCRNESILTACRAPSTPVRVSWLLELLLKREWGSLMRRQSVRSL